MKTLKKNSKFSLFCFSFSFFPTFQNAIDLDLREMERQLQLGSIQGYNAAMDIYSKGAYSAPIAKLKVDPLQRPLTFGDVVSGLSSTLEEEVKLTVVSNYPSGRDAILVKYSNTTTCIVGGLPDPVTDGCLVESGRLMVAGSSIGSTSDQIINYTYNILEDNLNQLSLQRLSTEKKTETTYWCKNCNSDDFSLFYKYYGVPDYADQWITAAGEGKMTDFFNGNANFVTFGLPGKSKAITTAILVMHIWMHIIYLMEDSHGTCNPSVPSSGVHSWDRAVAYYTGSLEGQSSGREGQSSGGMEAGVLLKALANELCESFKTCGLKSNSLDGEAFVNTEIMKYFKVGKNALVDGDKCFEVETSFKLIRKLMLIPLVQGALLSGYSQHLSPLDNGRDATAGATYAAAILPHINACNYNDAKTIHELLGTDKEGNDLDFKRLKIAIERNYACLGLSCGEVGGIWDSATNTYFPDAKPCKDGMYDKDDLYTLSVALGVAGGALLCVALVFSLAFGGKEPSLPVETMRDDDDDDDDDMDNEAADPGDELPEFT